MSTKISEELPLEPKLANLSLCNFRGGNQLPTSDEAEQFFKIPKMHSLGPILFHDCELKDIRDLVLKVGTKQIRVNRMCFICYSGYAMAQLKGGQRELVLPEDRVPVEGLVRTCDWIMQPTAKLEYLYIIHILAAAIFLKIEPLTEQIWYSLGKWDECSEDKAFAVLCGGYQLGDMHPMIGLNKNMLNRIKRFFLTLVASAEFVEMPVDHVRCLLESEELAVNTEKEVFYAAVRWLNYDWQARSRYVLYVMKAVRLYLLPLKFLMGLQSQSKVPALNRIIAQHQFRELAYEAYTARTLMLRNDGTMLFDQLCNILEIQVPMRRPFIYHNLCPYHRARPTDEEVKVSYRQFDHYLFLLQQSGPDTWKTLQVNEQSIETFDTENACNELLFANDYDDNDNDDNDNDDDDDDDD